MEIFWQEMKFQLGMSLWKILQLYGEFLVCVVAEGLQFYQIYNFHKC